jgi:hypothetical protein
MEYRATHLGRRIVLFVGLVLVGAAGCSDAPVGPSLSAVTVSDIALRSTTGNASLCCCRVTGTSVNRNSVPVHVTITFAAQDGAQEEPLSRVLYFIKDLQPNARHAIDAPGFLFPCAIIKDVRTEIDVTGIADPPF